MANVKLVFCGIPQKELAEKQLQLFVNDYGGLFIQIEDIESDSYDRIQFTVLDKETAIKLSKELRKQIALMD